MLLPLVTFRARIAGEFAGGLVSVHVLHMVDEEVSRAEQFAADGAGERVLRLVQVVLVVILRSESEL